MNLIDLPAYTPGHWLVALAAVLVLVLGVGRLVRVIVYDDFPPAVWWRKTWARITDDGPWTMLFTCHWCLPFWVVLVAGAWFAGGLFVAWLAWSWWLFWGALALAYVVSMVIERDDR